MRGVGLDTPGPASADGVISSKGSTNFSMPEWRGFDIRGALEARLGLPVVYSNDGNAAALYAHHVHFGADAHRRSSVSVVVGTGLGGGLVESGRVVRGAAGMAGELGHVSIPLDGILEAGSAAAGLQLRQSSATPRASPRCRRSQRNLLPYWLTRYPDHELAGVPRRLWRRSRYAVTPSGAIAMARAIFTQQAMAIGRLFTIVSNVTDPDAYFIGGGVVETTPEMRKWFVDLTTEHTMLREEQQRVASFAEVPDLDMAGSRGAALAAWDHLRAR